MPSNQPTEITTHILDEWYEARSFKAMLVGPDWTPNRTTSVYRSPLVAHEVTGTNWPAGGVEVDVVVSQASATYQSVVTVQAFTVADVTTEDPARYLVFYEVTGSAATDRIIRWHDLRASVIFTDQSFVFTASDVVHTTGLDR